MLVKKDLKITNKNIKIGNMPSTQKKKSTIMKVQEQANLLLKDKIEKENSNSIYKKPTLFLNKKLKNNNVEKARVIKEEAEKYGKIFFLNLLSDVTMNSCPLDETYKLYSEKEIKSNIYNYYKNLLENKVINEKEFKEDVIQKMYDDSMKCGKFLSERSLNSNFDIENDGKVLYEDFKNDFLFESVNLISKIKKNVEKVFEKEVERSKNINVLQKKLNDSILLQESGGPKVSAKELKDFEMAAKPTLYRTLNTINTKKYLQEKGIEQLTEESLDEINSENLIQYTLLETMNLFGIIKFDRERLNNKGFLQKFF